MEKKKDEKSKTVRAEWKPIIIQERMITKSVHSDKIKSQILKVKLEKNNKPKEEQ